MTEEIFAKPCVGAIIARVINGEKHILLQTRKKEDGEETNGMIEIPAGKIREYENIFSALRREVWEETGLRITKVFGEDEIISRKTGDTTTISFEPYCVTQNLSGAYSIILNTFLCEADGDLLSATNESENLRWVELRELKRLIEKEPEKIFFIHRNALEKYISSFNL